MCKTQKYQEGETRIVNGKGEGLKWKNGKGEEQSLINMSGRVTRVSENGKCCTIDFGKGPGEQTFSHDILIAHTCWKQICIWLASVQNSNKMQRFMPPRVLLSILALKNADLSLRMLSRLQVEEEEMIIVEASDHAMEEQ